ncbi:hypothetical protein Leryth_000400 [Lithospermum erythrorhizon]|nr:hypothetical protein Leryth_000400 [Lithospermum erythrorhizon]
MDKMEQLERAFSYLDENKDGKISAIELHRYVMLMGSEMSLDEVEEAMLLMDSDGDGSLCLEEFVKLVEGGGGGEEEDNHLKEAFRVYEMEGCGHITPKSLKRVLSMLGESKSMNECKTMIANFDLNGDGVLNFEEFKVMMSF